MIGNLELDLFLSQGLGGVRTDRGISDLYLDQDSLDFVLRQLKINSKPSLIVTSAHRRLLPPGTSEEIEQVFEVPSPPFLTLHRITSKTVHGLKTRDFLRLNTNTD